MYITPKRDSHFGENNLTAVAAEEGRWGCGIGVAMYTENDGNAW